jgi:hypothetical protein
VEENICLEEADYLDPSCHSDWQDEDEYFIEEIEVPQWIFHDEESMLTYLTYS